jgi:hypothetical protein
MNILLLIITFFILIRVFGLKEVNAFGVKFKFRR